MGNWKKKNKTSEVLNYLKKQQSNYIYRGV